MVSWKVAWARDSSYKTHRKSKAEQEEKLCAIQEEMHRKVMSLKSQMDARVNEAMQLALSQQRGISGSHSDVVISPASQRRSSCASTVVPDAPAEHPQIEAPEVGHQRYPVDDINIPTACELHV